MACDGSRGHRARLSWRVGNVRAGFVSWTVVSSTRSTPLRSQSTWSESRIAAKGISVSCDDSESLAGILCTALEAAAVVCDR